MKIVIQLIICALFGYCCGGLNPSYMLAKMKGFDIRGKGSGNAGASNAAITMGKKAGIFCALFDIFKAYIAVKFAIRIYPFLKIAGIMAGVFCILGHIFPVLLDFHGGKGLACLGGVVLAYNMKIFFLLLALEIAIVLIADYICYVPTSGSVIFTLILWNECGALYAIAFLPVVAAVFTKHMENFRRIRYGVEARVSYIWNKDNEILRLQTNWDNLTDEERSSFEEVYV